MGAAWDGPVVQGEGVVQHVIDDLILCSDCVRAAAALIGMGFVENVAAELHEAETANDHLMETIRGLKAYIQNLEAVRDGRPNEILDGPKRQSKRKVAA